MLNHLNYIQTVPSIDFNKKYITNKESASCSKINRLLKPKTLKFWDSPFPPNTKAQIIK